MLRAVLLLASALPLTAQPKDWPALPEAAMRLLQQGDTQGYLDALRAPAEGGDPVAMFWLGRSYEEVAGIPHDYPRALEWYRKAADKKVGVAAWSIGRLYDMGRGVPQDSAEAQTWYARALELGFRRTALAIVRVRWYPGSEDLTYEPVPEPLRTLPPSVSPELAFLSRRLPIDLSPAELDLLRNAGIRGRLVWQGGEPGLFGLPARLILIAQRPALEEVRLAVPLEGSLLYVQQGDGWQRLGEARPARRTIRLYPQAPDMPWQTGISLELEDGGTSGGSGWSWERP
jgi:hypothetical protein